MNNTKEKEIKIKSPLDHILMSMIKYKYDEVIKALPGVLEVDNSMISKWRNGLQIGTNHLRKLADYLECDIDDLI